jgi:molybdenum cofactor cytidylyltransferase
MDKVAILILAAGNSSRMEDKIKQLLPWRQTTLLGHAIHEAKKLKAQAVYVVLGANAEIIKPTISEKDVLILEYKYWKQGIGTSIAFGVQQLVKENKYDAVLIQLADQPYLDATYLRQLLNLYAKNNPIIIATKYRNTKGVPAIFNKDYFLDLINLNGDTGAKALLKSENVIAIDPKEKVVDIDTWEEYQRYFRAE